MDKDFRERKKIFEVLVKIVVFRSPELKKEFFTKCMYYMRAAGKTAQLMSTDLPANITQTPADNGYGN